MGSRSLKRPPQQVLNTRRGPGRKASSAVFTSSLPTPAVPVPPSLVERLTDARRFDALLIAFADRVHAAGDDLARREGWTVRREGLTGRAYRSPLFDGRSAR